MRKKLLVVGGVAAAWLAVAAVVIVAWPGPSVVVTNDTNQTLTLNDCGDFASQIPPGDVETLQPGAKVSIGSSWLQASNVCDVHVGDQPDPSSCLVLPKKGHVLVSQVRRSSEGSPPACDIYS